MLYPAGGRTGNLLHGWTNFDTCCKEVVRLEKFLTDFQSNVKDNTLFVLIIGAAMEEIYTDDIYVKSDQWDQLFPNYISEHKSGLNVQVVIVSPNSSFEEGVTPVFINKTNDTYNWLKSESQLSWVSTNGYVKVDIFCTAFPYAEKDVNNAKINNLKNLDFLQNSVYEKQINHMLQTDEDVCFVEKFYDSLDKTFSTVEEVGGLIICQSTASFNIHTKNVRYNNCYMFPKIKDLFSVKNNQRLLLEWIHNYKDKKLQFVQDLYLFPTLFRNTVIDYGSTINFRDKMCVKLYIEKQELEEKLQIQYHIYSGSFIGSKICYGYMKDKQIMIDQYNIKVKNELQNVRYCLKIVCTELTVLFKICEVLDRCIPFN